MSFESDGPDFEEIANEKEAQEQPAPSTHEEFMASQDKKEALEIYHDTLQAYHKAAPEYRERGVNSTLQSLGQELQAFEDQLYQATKEMEQLTATPEPGAPSVTASEKMQQNAKLMGLRGRISVRTQAIELIKQLLA